MMLAQELAQEQATVNGTTTDHITLYQKVGFYIVMHTGDGTAAEAGQLTSMQLYHIHTAPKWWS